ncbi:MAG TPA: type II toxin-antitoxin system PemK/MazF family toxin [Anaerolineae bacterium]|nr:type II toxin-antitoxin system PemK/MazF family toxin [Anaerolineae bacterium]
MSPRPWHPQRGEVVLVRFPFLEIGGWVRVKPRPAVVVSGPVIHEQTADVLIAAISSRPTSRPLPTDYQIPYDTPEARAAGLKKTSWVKASNLATVPRAAVARRLGHLTAGGLRTVDDRLRLALGLG